MSFQPGDRVRLVRVFGEPLSPEQQIVGTVEAVCESGALEVVHGEDGGGFDFWPADEVVAA